MGKLSSTLERLVGNAAIGFLPLVGVLAVFAGGVAQAVQIIMVSVICTAGAAAVVWVPIAAFLGTLLRGVWSLVSSGAKRIESPGAAMKAREHVALLRYAKRLGPSDVVPEDVQVMLLRNGWDAAEIRAAWTEARRAQS